MVENNGNEEIIIDNEEIIIDNEYKQELVNENREMITRVVVGSGLVLSIGKLVSSLLFFLIGLLVFFVSVISLVHDITYVETMAVIVDVRCENDKEMDMDVEMCYPTYEFDYNGEKVQVESGFFYERDELEIGSSEIICYNPKNYIQFDVGPKSGALMGFFISAVFLGSSIFFFIIFIKLAIYTIKGKGK